MATKNTRKQRVITCVYCGFNYPTGTAPHGESVLTDHIKVCEKHPMRALEKQNSVLRKALSGLIGAETKDELKALEIGIRLSIAPDHDKAVMINAIHALLETQES